jgi:CRISPR/Cas system-associated exonuclease Cas4 (RecB family)
MIPRTLSPQSGFTPTGLAVFYLHSCPVLAWLWVHGQLVVPQQNEYIRSGRRTDERKFSNKRSLDLMPYGKADWVTGTQTEPVIHEGTRSPRHTEPKRAQLRHYLWAAKQLYNIDATGKLHLEREDVETVEPDHDSVEADHERLRVLLEEPMPEPERIPICDGCTNEDWCWS